MSSKEQHAFSVSLKQPVKAIQYYHSQNEKEVIEMIRPVGGASVWNGTIRLGSNGNWYDSIMYGQWIVRFGEQDRDYLRLDDTAFNALFDIIP